MYRQGESAFVGAAFDVFFVKRVGGFCLFAVRQKHFIIERIDRCLRNALRGEIRIFNDVFCIYLTVRGRRLIGSFLHLIRQTVRFRFGYRRPRRIKQRRTADSVDSPVKAVPVLFTLRNKIYVRFGLGRKFSFLVLLRRFGIYRTFNIIPAVLRGF